MINGEVVAVVIPSYKVKKHILSVLASIGQECDRIYVVDDCCPDGSGVFVQEQCKDSRVVVVFNEKNKGVGGAVLRGYEQAITDGAGILVKIDGDGQMNPSLLPKFVLPIAQGLADYTKGNRFYDMKYISRMPVRRIIGNLGLSFFAKASTGYWNLFDPTNGYTAIHAKLATRLPKDKISSRYFFETDMLFRLNTLRAKVLDIPMDALYADEESNLKIYKVLGEFLFKHLRNYHKRIVYNYFLRDFSIASLELVIGIFLLLFGSYFGIYNWWKNAHLGMVTPTGTVMLAVVPIIVGIQLLLNFLSYDISSVPDKTQHPLL